MAPLPCSPVSNSTASESQSFDSDDSLITPRPGPSDPAQRTIANLSRPSIPPFSTSPGSAKSAARQSPPATTQKNGQASTSISGTSDPSAAVSTADGRPRNPYTYGTSTKAGAEPEARPLEPERRRSVNFAPQITDPRPNRVGSYSAFGRMHSPAVSPHAAVRKTVPEEPVYAEYESSADESTAIFRRERTAAGKQTYGAMAADEDDAHGQLGAYDAAAEEPGSPRRRKVSLSKRVVAGLLVKPDDFTTKRSRTVETTVKVRVGGGRWWRSTAASNWKTRAVSLVTILHWSELSSPGCAPPSHSRALALQSLNSSVSTPRLRRTTKHLQSTTPRRYHSLIRISCVTWASPSALHS